MARVSFVLFALAGCGDDGGHASLCGPGTTDCGGTCKDLSVDSANCGECGAECSASQVCDSGTCASACSGSLAECGGGCVDVAYDPAHCGACDAACAANEFCVEGACQSSCGALAECGDVCRDVAADPGHCGDCDTACAGGQVCSAGTCALSCQAGLTDCSGWCRDTASDRSNCGGCGATCADGEICDAGTCRVSCQAGLVDCGGTCVDPNTDRRFCGASGDCTGPNDGAACAAGQICNGAGVCARSCQTQLVDCGAICTNPDTDRGHCGASGDCLGANAGEACGDGEICQAGVCGPSCGPGLTRCDDACVDLDHDPDHCSACDTPCGAAEACYDGGCVAYDRYETFGVRQDVREDALAGWTQCFSSTYDEDGQDYAACDGANLLMACRPVGSPTFTLLAHAPRASVLFDCGNQPNCTRQDNGVGWYYSGSFSWGFAPGGLAVNRASCDFGGVEPERRMCVHTWGDRINTGYRCGDNDLNADAGWERVIYEAD